MACTKGAQQFDNYGKIFTVKVQYVFYKERPGIRPGQVTKAERLTSRLQQFAAYAIQGDYNGVKEFGSDLRKLGIPVEHAPHVSRRLECYTTRHSLRVTFYTTAAVLDIGVAETRNDQLRGTKRV